MNCFSKAISIESVINNCYHVSDKYRKQYLQWYLFSLNKSSCSLGKTGKHLPSEKKIANLLFCRYITPAFLSNTIYQRAGVRVVEWARLESVCTGNSTEGSNPSLSAINFPPQYIRNGYIAVFVCRSMGKILGKRVILLLLSPSEILQEVLTMRNPKA